MSFDFHNQALNMFLTSGNFDGLEGIQPAPIRPAPVRTSPPFSPTQLEQSIQYHLLSDPFQASRFTNLQEEDLEKEAVDRSMVLDN